MADTQSIARDEVAELNQIRLDEGLTFAELADQIGDIDVGTLHRVLRHPDRKPFDRTLHKLRRFLDERKTAKPAKRRSA